MRPHTQRLVDLLEGPVVTYGCRAESWYAGELLTESLPVTEGTVTSTADVIDTAEAALSVPYAGEIDLSDPLNPLGAYGQRLRLSIEVGSLDEGPPENIPLGWFRNMPSVAAGGSIDLRARDLSVEIERARLVTPLQMTTPVSTNPATEPFDTAPALTQLVTGILPVAVLDTLPDLAGALYVLRDRKQGIVDLLQAVSATASVDVSGAFVVTSVPDLDDPDPVLIFTDGTGETPAGKRGTLIELRPEANDSRGFNACIVQGVTEEGAPVYGGAFVEDGPMAWPVQSDVVSPYGTNPGFFFSPLLRTVDACKAAARSILNGWMLGANGSFTASSAPDPRLEVNDVVELRKDGAPHLGLVQSVALPLTASSGAMTFSGVLL